MINETERDRMRTRLTNRLRSLLRNLQSKRSKRQEFVGGEPAWVHYERRQMLESINTSRALLHKPPIEITRVIAAEEASYYQNYVERFSRACAELVLE